MENGEPVMKKFLNMFKALSDQTRLRILCVLSKAGTELCVCEIMDSLGENQYNISRHLRVLENAGLVQERKEGRWMFYSLMKPATQFQTSLHQTVQSVPEDLLTKDYARLARRLSFREMGKCVVGMNSPKWNDIRRGLEIQEKSPNSQ